MRQAGRSLPEYHRVREGIAMLEACTRPELVAEITMQPLRRYDVDAAVLYSDIVVPLRAVGVDVDIKPGVGPVLGRPFRTMSDVERLRPLEPDDVPYISEAVKSRLLVDELGFDEGIDYRAGLAEGLAAAAPDGIDLYFDNVGGDHLVAALYALRLHGRVALCGMISTMEDATSAPGVQHLIQAVLKRLTLRGFIVRDHEDLRPEFEKQVANWLRTGELISKQTVVDGLENAVDAFIGLLSGANVGKMLVRVSSDDSAAS
jgi:hypothetical protein